MRGEAGRRLAIVIPAHNEASRLSDLLRSLEPAGQEFATRWVIVVDDGSTDDTVAAGRSAGAIVLRHRINLGKGAALLTGCEAARRLGADLMLLMDADGQHQAADIPRMLEPLLTGKAQVVIGVRRLAGQMPAPFRIGNRLLNATIRTLFGIKISDTQCGFRAFSSSVFPALRWEASDYAVESEMLIRMARARLAYVAVPIATVYHDRYKGTQPLDGLRILRQLVVWRLRA